MKKITIFICICCFSFILFVFLKENRQLTHIEAFIKDTSLFIQKVISKPIDYIDYNLKKSFKKNRIYDKYKIIKEENEKLKQENSKYQIILNELNSLKNNLDLKNSLADYKIIDAYVINRNIGSFYNELIIDKGKKNGIKKGMSVINSNGLIGIITKVTNNNSVVKLITGNSTKIGISINEQYGLISDYQDNYFIIEGINESINKGDVVTTIGTNNIPKGLKIGYVEKSITDKFNLTKKIYVKSYVNFDNIDYVMVLYI